MQDDGTLKLGASIVNMLVHLVYVIKKCQVPD